MNVWLTRDFLRTGKIEEGQGTVLTGRPLEIQVNGKPPGGLWRNRIFKKPDWHTDLDAAVARAREMIRAATEFHERERVRLSRAQDSLGAYATRLQELGRDYQVEVAFPAPPTWVDDIAVVREFAAGLPENHKAVLIRLCRERARTTCICGCHLSEAF